MHVQGWTRSVTVRDDLMHASSESDTGLIRRSLVVKLSRVNPDRLFPGSFKFSCFPIFDSKMLSTVPSQQKFKFSVELQRSLSCWSN